MFLLSSAMPVLALVPRGRWWKGALEIAGTHETKELLFFSGFFYLFVQFFIS